MEELFDVVIVGSGLGGLECAYILSKEGYRVCVVEKNRQFGGNLQFFSRDKVIFDTGVHYIGGLDCGQNLNQYFTYFGLMKELKLRRMNVSGFDRITFDEDQKEYCHAMGYPQFEESLIKDFPEEKSGILNYTAKLQETSAYFDLYNMQERSHNVFDAKYLGIRAKSVVESFTTNEKLRNVLAGSNALYAGSSQKAPWYIHALVVNTYIESAYKCVDGAGQITRYFQRVLKDQGCTMMKYAQVVKLQDDGNQIIACELKDGRRIRGKQFISNIHPVQTMSLIESNLIRRAYRTRIESLKNSISVFTLHIVFKDKSFKYLNYNFYHHKSNDTWASIDYKESSWPEGYALFVPANSQSEEYASGMNVMAYMRFDELSPWVDSFHTVPNYDSERSPSYQDWKIEKAEKLLDELELKWPDIRSKIKSYYTSTPLSFRDYIGTGDGSLYGIQKDFNNPLKSYISPRTRIPNLFLTGQNLNVHGLLGVTVSAFVTCGLFVGINYLVNKIKEAN